MSHPIAPFEQPFAHGIFKQKYAHPGEEWPDTAMRVTSNVMSALHDTPGGARLLQDGDHVHRIYNLIEDRQFMPGGRYLYASGRGLHQVQNCLLLRAEDTREGWAELTQKSTMALMTGAGIGIDYSDVRPSGSVITRTGGIASGPISLMKMINEVGRNVMQGGARRSAIWAGLRWNHSDVFDFIAAKDWSDEVRALKDKDFTFPADLDMTNISVILDKDFFDAYHDPTNPQHDHALKVYRRTLDRMLRTAEPGFSVDYENPRESLRNAPVAGGTKVLTDEGYKSVESIVGVPTTLWTGHRWAENVVFSKTFDDAPILKVKMTGGREIRCEPNHEFLVERWTGAGARKQLDGIVRVKAKELKENDRLHVSLPVVSENLAFDNEAYTLGFIYGDGSFHKSGSVDLSLCTEESKACAEQLVGAASINKEDRRGHTRMYFPVSERWSGRTKDVFPSDVYAMSEDSIRSFLAGLFDADGNWEATQKRIRLSSKHRSFLIGVARAFEQLGIIAHVSKAGHSTYGKAQTWQLVIASEYSSLFAATIPTKRLNPDLRSYASYRASSINVVLVEPDGYEDVYCADVKVPEHSFMAEGVIISNCTEVTSEDDSDVCNLGSLNMARFDNIDQFASAVRDATLFLLAGSVYSDLPYDKVYETREKNRRLGLGVMGIHEWLLKRGKPYGPDEELGQWLAEYARSTEYAHEYADRLGITRPIKTRAIAPTGTIGILAETTTGIEPIFCAAYKRRVRNAHHSGDKIEFEYVVDPTAKRLIDQGVNPNTIEDAYTLSYDVERRIEFQAWVQQYVDHGISSTINLPFPIADEAEQAEFGSTLMKYLPKMRGVTVYPDGARGGQPLTPVDVNYALQNSGVRFEEHEDKCVGGLCGT